MQQWYVGYTKANAELQALAHLTNQGFNAYLPRYSKLRRHARKTQRITAPLFPRYLFIRLDIEKDRWRPLLSTIGLSQLICRGDKPAPISDSVIEAIHGRENVSGLVELCAPDTLKLGSKVQIISGHFAEMDGLFDGNSVNNRIHVLLELMGRTIRVEIPSTSLMSN